MNSAAEWCGSSRCAAVPQPAPEICWNGPSEVPSLVGGILTPDSTIAVSHAARRTFGGDVEAVELLADRDRDPRVRRPERDAAGAADEEAREPGRRRRVPVDELDLQERVGQRAGRAEPAAEAGRRGAALEVDVHVVEVVLDLPQRVEAELDQVRAHLVDHRRLDPRRVVEVDRAGAAARVVERGGLALAAGRHRRPAHVRVLVRRDRAVLLEEVGEHLHVRRSRAACGGPWRGPSTACR